MAEPVRKTGRRWIIGCLTVFGAVVLFCAGIVLGRQQTRPERPEKPPVGLTRRSAKPLVRNVFSPSVIGDPYVRDEQRKVVEALERSCRLANENCDTAQKARAYLDVQQ